ncbi:hypothetical protein THAOC_01989 [Thalassiosira oceanica]|uniref:Uncharacterized protein n=1 Tax=Thalassiosira oceanica TaxID=159749 RepID=K0TGX8_THAOC|nr:hypothetical protein THAOC_01989 [Thalassiosira oceanica]|eukprot:EJK76259.1 hypothetical protein THAOC_01989 [Thalassiosira oceanica]
MYFSSLQALCLIFVLAGLLNTFNILYYSSAEYDPERGLSVENLSRVIEMVQYSAVCLSREWVVCADCENERTWWDNMFTREFYGTADDGEGGTVTLIDRTTCMPAQGKEGMVNYGTMLLLIVCMGLFSWYLNKREVRFDEDNTTASDYSIVVRNPPEDAVDPDEWRDFFDTFADKGVTLVTVALDNEPLIQKLVARRRDIKLLLHKLPPKLTLDFDDEEGTEKIILDCMAKRIAADNSWFITKIFAGIKSFSISFLGYQDGYFQSEEKIWNRIKNTNDEIRELQQREYNAASVFVTFETEQGQRTALEAMNFSKAEVFLNNSNMRVDQSALFKGRVLECHEAPEPNAVLATMAITLGLCLLSALILFRSRLTLSTMAFSIILSTFNSIIPVLVRMMVNYEKHYNEGSRQASIYIKITGWLMPLLFPGEFYVNYAHLLQVFRWVNTAVITRLITPFLATLGGRSKDLPLLRYLDPFVILDRHYFAPRAKSDEELYFCFRGGWYNLSERFTDFTKVLLLCTFYSAFMPMIWWLGAAILFFQCKRFAVFSLWLLRSKVPLSWFGATHNLRLDGQVSIAQVLEKGTLSRTCLGIISSGYAYAQSPYTNLCSCNADEPETEVCDGLTTQREFSDVLLLNNTVLSEVLAVDEASYFCNQDNVAFPPTPQNQSYSNQWMTDSQELLCRIYGITCIVLVCAYGFFILGGRLALFIKCEFLDYACLSFHTTALTSLLH